MNGASFEDYMQNQLGLTEAQLTQAARNHADLAKLAISYVSALQAVGFTRREAIQIYCAMNGYAQTLTLVSPREDAS